MRSEKQLLHALKERMDGRLNMVEAARELYEEGWGSPGESPQDFFSRVSTIYGDSRLFDFDVVRRYPVIGHQGRDHRIIGGGDRDSRVDPAQDGYQPLPVEERDW